MSQVCENFNQIHSHNLHFKITGLARRFSGRRNCPQAGYIVVIESFSSGQLLSRVRLLATPRTIAYQAPLSMGFSRQEYWIGVPLPSPLVSLGRYIPRYFILFVALVNGIVALISLFSHY